MNARCWPLLICFLLSQFSLNAQVLEHLRALATTRYPVGDPGISATNLSQAAVDGPKDVAVADLDQDGKLDVAASDKDGSVTVYFGLGNGDFSSALTLRTWTNAPRDAKGFMITNYVTNTCVMVWTNRWLSNGLLQTNWTTTCLPIPPVIFTNIFRIADGPTGLRGLALADFTGDKLPDIAVASPGESVIYLFVNLGGRKFSAPKEINAWFGVRDLAAGDFDGDGKIDLAAAGTTNGLAQYRSLGGGAFDRVTNVLTAGTSSLDNDFPQPAFYLKAFRPPGATRDELVMAHAQGNFRTFAADSSGRLAIQNTLTNFEIHAVDVGPLLHDRTSGIPDLVTVNHGDELLEIHAFTNTPGHFTTNVARSITIPGRAHGVAIADIDNDGWNDLVVVLQRFARVRVLRNNRGTFEAVSETATGAGPRELAAGDFNGDGRVDAAVLNRFSNDISILQSSTNGFGFATLNMIYPADGEVVALKIYDFNGDGRDDVVQLHRSAGEMSVRLARPDGSLSDAVYYRLGERPTDTRVVDLNNDGVMDVLAVDLGGFVSARLGNRDGTFGPELRTALRGTGPDGASWGGPLFSLATADFDGDGKVDLAAGYLDCRVGFFKGLGDGTFLHTQTHYLAYEARGMAVGDFDGDGKIDLVGSPWIGGLVVIKNHGDILTTPALDRLSITNTVPTSAVRSILTGDFNKDGDLDLLVDGEPATLYLGGPGVSFTPSTNYFRGVNEVATATPLKADFNQDGIPDIMSVCVDHACVQVSLGQAGGNFAQPFQIKSPVTDLIATGDLDGDGLPDVVGAGEVLWTALSSRAPGQGSPAGLEITRTNLGLVVINEVLAANSSFELPADGGRKSDYLELFNSGGKPLGLSGWRLLLERTNAAGQFAVSTYNFPTNGIIDAKGYLVLVCSDKIRSVYHTGFVLPAEGGVLRLISNNGTEADRVSYPAQKEGRAYARFQDGVNGFVFTDTPSPGAPNPNTGLLPPDLSIEGIDLETVLPNKPIRFFAKAKDDLGIVNVSLIWRRLDIPDSVNKRVILYDDGTHEDRAALDGYFSGLFEPGLAPGAQIQFYLECTDLSGVVVTAPGSPRFVQPGEARPSLFTLAVGVPPPSIELSEVVANNTGALVDEQGKTPDWLEIRNTSSRSVALPNISLAQNFFATDNRLDFDGLLTLRAGEHAVVYADNEPKMGTFHAPFKMDKAGDRLILIGETALGAKYIIDHIAFGPQGTNQALARLGKSGPWAETTATPRLPNVERGWRALINSNSFVLAYPTQTGRKYTVEHKENLTDPWTVTAPTISGAGLEQTFQYPIFTTRFFRVREE